MSIKITDTEVLEFIARTESFYPPDGYGLSVAENRRLYDEMCAAFRQPRPASVTVADRTIPGPDGPIPIRRYRTEASGPVTVIYMHGGGYLLGGLDSHDDICAEIADRTGCKVVSVDYRLCPEHAHPAQYDDCLAVARAVLHEGPVILAGDSAGGNFATVCCLLAHERSGPAIAHQVLIYPGVDLSGRHDEEQGPQEGADGMNLGSFMASVYVDRPELLADPRCSPWLAEDVSFMPPTLVLTAEYCFIRDQGESYAGKLAAASVPTRAIRYNGVNHAFLDKVGVWPYADACIEDIAEVLTSQT